MELDDFEKLIIFIKQIFAPSTDMPCISDSDPDDIGKSALDKYRVTIYDGNPRDPKRRLDVKLRIGDSRAGAGQPLLMMQLVDKLDGDGPWPTVVWMTTDMNPSAVLSTLSGAMEEVSGIEYPFIGKVIDGQFERRYSMWRR